METVKTLAFDVAVSSMEYIADGEILVITYGKTIAFYDALRYGGGVMSAMLVWQGLLSVSFTKVLDQRVKLSALSLM